MTKERIAFIGLGTMGKPMAMNLCKAGYPLTVVDLNATAFSDLVAAGARSADSPRKAAEEADVVIVMVWDGDQTKEVMLGPSGALAALKRGGIVLLMNTIHPEVIQTIAKTGAERGIAVLDAPVSGAQRRASLGTLTIMVGGSQSVFEQCKPILGAMGNEIFYLGGIGAGITGKLVNNMLALIHLMAATEAIRLGACAGVDSGPLVDMLKTATGMSQIVVVWKKIDKAFDVGEYYRPGGVWELMKKDMRLVLDFARKQGAPIPLADLATEVYEGLNFSSRKNPFAPE